MIDLVLYEFKNMPEDESKSDGIIDEVFERTFVHMHDKESGKYYVAALMNLKKPPENITMRKVDGKVGDLGEDDMAAVKALIPFVEEKLLDVAGCWDVARKPCLEEDEI